MNMKTVLGCIFFLCASISAAAQDICYLSEKIKNSVKEKEPGWELKRDADFVIDSSSGVIILRWQSGDVSMETIVVMSMRSESAVKNYHEVEQGQSFVGINMKTLKDESFRLGDEHFLWIASDCPDTTGIVFRKGRVFVFLKTRDMAVTKRFAEDIAAQIPPH